MQVSTTANKTSGMKNSKTAVVVVKIESCANWTSHVPGILILPSCHTSQNIIDGPYIRKESIHDDAINVRHLFFVSRWWYETPDLSNINIDSVWQCFDHTILHPWQEVTFSLQHVHFQFCYCRFYSRIYSNADILGLHYRPEFIMAG
jgi:hypothetical protein